MGQESKSIKSSRGSVEIFTDDGKVASFSKGSGRIGGSSFRTSAKDPSRTYMGDWMGNPASIYVPSNIVTPEVVWLPLPEGLGVIGSILWGVKDLIKAAEEDLGSSGLLTPGKIVRQERYQVVDYAQRLPEDV